MIQFEKKYEINEGNGSITFRKINEIKVEAEYNRGTIQGDWDGEMLRGTFKDHISGGVGLIHFIFHKNSFEAKWKSGLDEGPFRGKWSGKLNLDVSKVIENTSFQGSYFKELIGTFHTISFTLENTEGAIQQGGSDNFSITFDIESQELKQEHPWRTMEEGKIMFYTGSPCIEIFEDYLCNEEMEYPGFLMININDTWAIPFHGDLYSIDEWDTAGIEVEKYQILKSTLSRKAIYHFLQNAFTFIKN